MVLTHRDFKAWITCDGKVLEEVQVEVPKDTKSKERNTIACWIPSVAGKKFSVFWEDLRGVHASCGHVFIDGADVASAIMREGRRTPVERSGVKIKSRKSKPFTFAELNLTDDEALAKKDDLSLKDMGTIEIRIGYVRLGAAVSFKSTEVKERGLVHEEDKKAGAHYTAFGETTVVPPSRAVSNAPLDPKNPGPHVTFVFRYRSRDMLMAMKMIPLPRRKKRQARPDDDDEDEAGPADKDKTDDDDDIEEGPAKPASTVKTGPPAKKARKEKPIELDSTQADPSEKPLFMEDDNEEE